MTTTSRRSTGGGGRDDVPPAPSPPPARHHENLRRIYDEMRSRQLRAIGKAGCLRPDPFFVPDGRIPKDERRGSSSAPPICRADSIAGDASTDDRRCLAVSSIIDGSVKCRWTDDFVELVGRLRDEFGRYGLTFARDPDDPDFGGGGQLHWTLMQLVGFADYESEVLGMQSDDGIEVEYDVKEDEDARPSATSSSSLYTSDHYLDTVQDSLTVGGLDAAVTITYVGVMVVSTGLLMVGLPSLDANAARDAVRSRLARRDLPLREPFVNDIVHSTLYRVASGGADGAGVVVVEDMPPDLHLRLAALAEEYRDVELGTVVLDRFQIGPASWRVLPDEMGATPPLRAWTVPSTAPSESYGEAVSAEEDGEGRGCHTVSGASGANLAREVRRALSRQSSSEVEQRKENVPMVVRPGEPTKRAEDLVRGGGGHLPVKAVGPRAASPRPNFLLGEMKNSPEELYERISSMNVRDSLPPGEVLTKLPSFGEGTSSQSQSGSEEEMVVRDNAATISGAGGAALGRELLRKLEDERRELDRLYYTDFH